MNSSLNAPALVRSLLLLCSLSAPAAAQMGGGGSMAGDIDNGLVKLSYDVDNQKGLILTQIEDSGDPTRSFTLDPVALWDIAIRDPLSTVKDDNVHVTPKLGPGASFGFVSKTPTKIVYRWRGVTHPDLPANDELEVRLRAVAKPNDFAVRFTVTATLTSSTRSVFQVTSPRIQFQERAGGSDYDQILTFPRGQGLLVPNPMRSEYLKTAFGPNASGDYPDPAKNDHGMHPARLVMQFFSYYNQSETNPANLFLGTRDGIAGNYGHFKSFAFEPIEQAGPDALLFSVTHFPQDNLDRLAFTTPYTTVAGILEGDWFDAARKYREWAIARPWTSQGPMHTGDWYPSGVKDAQMIATSNLDTCLPPGYGSTDEWSRSDADFAFLPAAVTEHLNVFGITNMPTFLYHWDNDNMSAEWGNYFPAEPEFRNVVANTVLAGTDIAPYAMLNHWTVSSNFHDGFPTGSNSPDPSYSTHHVTEYAVHDVLGDPDQDDEDYYPRDGDCSVIPPLLNSDKVYLDPSTDFVKDLALHIVDTMFDDNALYGTIRDQPLGMYFDSFTQSPPRLSYGGTYLGHLGGGKIDVDPTASPSGGGNWWVSARRDVLQSTLDRMETHGVDGFFLMSEAGTETYLDVVHMTLGHLGDDPRDIDIGGVEQPYLRTAPLQQTVYHDYHRTTQVRQLNGPAVVLPIISDEHRRRFAVDMFYGHAPWGGQRLAVDTIASNMAHVNGGQYTLLIEMVQNYMNVLKLDPVRDLLVFGARERDFFWEPADRVVKDILLWNHTGEKAASIPYDESQPMVYASVFSRVDLESFAIQMLNWTDDSDDFGGGIVGGDKSLSVTVDPNDYGLPDGNYDLDEYHGTTVTTTLGIDMTNPVVIARTVPERDLRVLVFTKQ